jgi:hypothetical protein
VDSLSAISADCYRLTPRHSCNSEGPRHLADIVSNSSSSVARITAVHTLLSFPLINSSGVHGRSAVSRMRRASPAPYRPLYNIRSALIEYARVYTRYLAGGSRLRVASIHFSREFQIHSRHWRDSPRSRDSRKRDGIMNRECIHSMDPA